MPHSPTMTTPRLPWQRLWLAALVVAIITPLGGCLDADKQSATIQRGHVAEANQSIAKMLNNWPVHAAGIDTTRKVFVSAKMPEYVRQTPKKYYLVIRPHGEDRYVWRGDGGAAQSKVGINIGATVKKVDLEITDKHWYVKARKTVEVTSNGRVFVTDWSAP